MQWLSAVIFLCFTFSSNVTQAKHQRQPPSGVVVGTVYCNNTCPSYPKSIPGASVAVECNNSSSTPRFRLKLKTNNHGEFKVRLPFSVHKHVETIRECYVRLISSNTSLCDVPAMTSSSSLHLKSRKHGTHIFSPGLLTFSPSKHPQACEQQPSTSDFKNRRNARNEPSPISNPNEEIEQLLDGKADQPIMPSQLPPNPFYPPIVFPPNPFQPPISSFLPPNPSFQPPPARFPPFSPSPPAFNFPPVPGLVTPRPPPRPVFPIPFPPFPSQPTPGFPGAPPAGASSSSP